MRSRPSSRLLLIDSAGRVLLFKFVHNSGALAGRQYWATPGGGVEEGETFEQAAIRELAEETGVRAADVGREIGRRVFELQLTDGEIVLADERFFAVRATDSRISRDGWSAAEHEVMADHRWWSAEALAQTTELVYPENLPDLFRAAAARLG